MSVKNIEIKNQNQVDETVGEHIGYDLGVKMVKDYYDQYGEGNPHFVGKNILVKILNQPDCIGVNIYNAINEKGDKTFVIVGLNRESKPILEIVSVNENGKLKNSEGIVADRNKVVQGWFDL